MLQKERNILIQAQMFLDAILCMLALWMAHGLRGLIHVRFLPSPGEIEAFDQFAWMLLLIPFLAPFVFYSQGYYARELLPSSRLRHYAALARGCLLLFVFMIFVMFLKKFTLARSVLLLFLILTFTLVMLKDEALQLFRRSSMGKTQFQRRVIIASSGSEIGHIHKTLSELGSHDFEIVGNYDLNNAKEDTLLDMLHDLSANIVLIDSKYDQFSEVEKMIQRCELEGVDVWVLANFFRTELCATSLDMLQGSPLLVFRTAPDFTMQTFGKQMFDYVGSFLLLLLLSPLLLLICLAIKISSPGPIFFSQKRSGLNGIPFTMYKFRSMINNAEMKKHELERLNEMSGPVFKVSNDPRVTKIGAFLRKTSLDELPQLYNVLKGEMSLVGPRPLPVDETLRFDDIAHRRRLSMRPGLTCLWQISGRNNVTDFNEWVRLDLEYIDNWSFWGDFKILFKTIPVVFRGIGAR
ncbi:MAG: sugar transferase [Limisphaerales bacterium]|jgi:exopolysaccharide biosynthesis polyprenyl glycosylphosphotransferase